MKILIILVCIILFVGLLLCVEESSMKKEPEVIIYGDYHKARLSILNNAPVIFFLSDKRPPSPEDEKKHPLTAGYNSTLQMLKYEGNNTSIDRPIAKFKICSGGDRWPDYSIKLNNNILHLVYQETRPGVFHPLIYATKNLEKIEVQEERLKGIEVVRKLDLLAQDINFIIMDETFSSFLGIIFSKETRGRICLATKPADVEQNKEWKFQEDIVEDYSQPKIVRVDKDKFLLFALTIKENKLTVFPLHLFENNWQVKKGSEKSILTQSLSCFTVVDSPKLLSVLAIEKPKGGQTILHFFKSEDQGKTWHIEGDTSLENWDIETIDAIEIKGDILAAMTGVNTKEKKRGIIITSFSFAEEKKPEDKHRK